MLKSGIYIAENTETLWSSYKIRMEVKETDKSYIFKLIECESHYAAEHIRLLFEKSDRFVMRKEKGGHAIRLWNDGSFTLYPFQAGIPYYFKLEEPPVQTADPGKKWIQIWYSWGDQEEPVAVPEGKDAWEYAKMLAVNEAAVAAEDRTDIEMGIRFYEDEGKIALHYTYDDTFCYYQITDAEEYTPN